MTNAGVSSSGDALSRLRIHRDAPPRRSFLGRLVRGFVWLAFVIGLLVGGIFAGQKYGWIPQSDRLLENVRPKLEVRTSLVSVETGRSADAAVVATGYIESRRQARIGARATGRIEAVNVEEGSKVKADDILAVLEHADLDAAIVAAEATAQRSKSELLEQDVEIQRTKAEFERAEKAIAAKTMTAAEFDTVRFQRDAAVAKRTSLEAALALAEARVQEAKQLRENMFVRAPFAGTVISRDAELGESIMPGGMGEASGRGSVATIADLDRLEVDCDVKEDFINRISEQQTTEIAVDAVPDRRYSGRVRKIIPMGDRARATVKVKVEITDADPRLFPDMSGTVYFLPNSAETAPVDEKPRIFCPNDGIHGESEKFVWLLTSDDRLKKVVITIGEKKDDRTEVLSGLSGGEKVVVSKPAEFRDGMLVKTAQ